MIKALLVVMPVTGSEYNINMPDMKTCMEQARVVISQDTATETLCIPRADKSAKVKEIFSLFGNMVERLQENERRAFDKECRDRFTNM